MDSIRKAETEKGKTPWWRSAYFRISVILAVVCITIFVFVTFRERVKEFENYGYFGAFLVNLIASASLVLPVPAIAVVFTLGGIINPVLVGLVSGLGAALGEITGYLAGYGGQILFERGRYYDTLVNWMKRKGDITLFVLSVVPNPIFDIAGATAGALGFPLWRFLVITWAGKTVKSLGIAFAGYWGLQFLLRFLA